MRRLKRIRVVLTCIIFDHNAELLSWGNWLAAEPHEWYCHRCQKRWETRPYFYGFNDYEKNYPRETSMKKERNE